MAAEEQCIMILKKSNFAKCEQTSNAAQPKLHVTPLRLEVSGEIFKYLAREQKPLKKIEPLV